MLKVTSCPVCNADTWKPLGSRVYLASLARELSEYKARRFRVLFELWFPGQTEVRIQSQMCKSCGFVIYTPRPTAEDLDRKYKFLTELEADQHSFPPDTPVEKLRSQNLFGRLNRWTNSGNARILDFGGGDGRLMSNFVEHGCECFLVDYCPTPVQGVTKLADTLDDLGDDTTFDLIVCSHVLEHLADPFGIVVQLQHRLADEGVLYVEVPMEIWGAAPLQSEPVTHINFFTVASLQYLLERAGFCMLKCDMVATLHQSGNKPTAVRALAVKAAGSNVTGTTCTGSAAATERLLSPDWRMYLRMLSIHPEWLWPAIRNRLQRWTGIGK